MYIDIGETIAGKQNGPSLIIEEPYRVPQIAQTYILAYLWKLVFISFPLVVHMSPL